MRPRALLVLALTACNSPPSSLAGSQPPERSDDTYVPPGPTEHPAGERGAPPLDSEGRLLAAWEHRPSAPDVRIEWPGIVDPAGNCYWVEWTDRDSPKLLRSLDRDGAERFAVSLDLPDTIHPTVLLADGLVVTLSEPGTTVEARSFLDGALVWRTELTASLLARVTGDARVASMALSAPPPARAGDDLLFAVRVAGGNFPEDLDVRGTVVMALHLGSGQPRWARRVGAVPASATFIFGDTAGRSWVSAFDQVSGMDPGGALLFQAPLDDGDGMRAVGGGVLLGANGGAMSADTGEVVAARGPGTSPLLGKGFLFAFDPGGRHRLTLAKRVAPDFGTTWQVVLDVAPDPEVFLFWSLGGPILTDAGTIVLTSQAQYFRRPALASPVLREIAPDGTTLLVAELPDSVLHPRAALRGGRFWLAGSDAEGAFIRAFDLPGRTTAPTGWAAEDGGMERDRRVR